jgi:hypothetical protein
MGPPDVLLPRGQCALGCPRRLVLRCLGEDTRCYLDSAREQSWVRNESLNDPGTKREVWAGSYGTSWPCPLNEDIPGSTRIHWIVSSPSTRSPPPRHLPIQPIPPGAKSMTLAPSSMVALRKGSNHQFYNDFSEDHDTINEPTSLTRPEAQGLLSKFNTQGTPRVGFHDRAHLS